MATRYMKRCSAPLIISEMQTKILSRCQFSSVKKVINNNNNNRTKQNKKKQKITSVGKHVEKLEPLWLLVGMLNSVATMENNMEVPQKIKNKPTIWSSNPIPGYLFKRIEIRVSNRYLYYVHCSIVHKSKEVKSSQCLLTDE